MVKLDRWLASGYMGSHETLQAIERLNLMTLLPEWVTKLQHQRDPFTAEEQLEIIAVLNGTSLVDGRFYLGQLETLTCYGPARALIVDTLSLICYGQARMSDPLVYGSIIDPLRHDDILAVKRSAKNDRNRFRRGEIERELNGFLQRWLSLPGGFEDMLYTLYVIVMGPIKPPQGGFYLNTQS